jgi:hypothetical protein
MLSAFPPIPLPADLRRTCLLALQTAVKGPPPPPPPSFLLEGNCMLPVLDVIHRRVPDLHTHMKRVSLQLPTAMQSIWLKAESDYTLEF